MKQIFDAKYLSDIKKGASSIAATNLRLLKYRTRFLYKL